MDDQFVKLFKYLDQRFDQVDQRFESQDERFNRIESTLDALAKGQEINDDERLVIGHQLERMDRWVHQLADKVGIQLSS